jgi:hypothetical protein
LIALPPIDIVRRTSRPPVNVSIACGEKVCSFDLSYDRLALLEQLGMTQAPGAGRGTSAGGAEARP